MCNLISLSLDICKDAETMWVGKNSAMGIPNSPKCNWLKQQKSLHLKILASYFTYELRELSIDNPRFVGPNNSQESSKGSDWHRDVENDFLGQAISIGHKIWTIPCVSEAMQLRLCD